MDKAAITDNDQFRENADTFVFSQEVKEIISYKPVWVVRNGILFFFIAFCLLICATFFISYPNVITARAKLYMDSSSGCFGIVTITANNFHLIQRGQKVFLKLYAYPFHEYGTVDGLLDSISPTPNDSGFTARLMLPKGLKTSFNKQLQFIPALTAEAGIITQDIKLSDRLFAQFKHLMK